MNNYKHWNMEIDGDFIAWLGINRRDANVNTINSEVLHELNSLLQDISQNKDIQGLVIYSLKTKGFIAGADIHEFAHFDHAQTVEFLRKGQAVFARIESLTIPTVAMIDGFCQGGGLELALACDYRVATNDVNTQLGLPEVLLGIHPGWGGTVRLPKLIGGFQALSKVILPGSAIAAQKAKKMGIVDEVVPRRQLRSATLYYLQHLPHKHQPSMLESCSHYSWSRYLLAQLMRRELAKKVNERHYPAPYSVINLWEKEGGFDGRAYLKEVESVERLISCNKTAANLTRIFLLRDRLKSFAKESSSQDPKTAEHAQILTVHVIGAGVMGGDIAAWCALRGLQVTLQDKTAVQIAPAIGRARKLFAKKLREPRLIQAAMDRLIPDPNGCGVARADVIIEAVFENLEVKQAIFKHVEATAKANAIIATNTSSIPLDEINLVMKNPERLIGIHFFNPVAQMQLVEVVSGKQTSAETQAQACAFVGQIGRLPLPVTSTPGFLVNRVLMPYLLECMHLLAEGYAPEVIDEAATSFGMLMGPVELADTVGLDVCLAVADNLTKHFGGTVPEKLRELVAEGHCGRKTGSGFYRYKSGKPIKRKINPESIKSTEIAQKLIARMVDEAKICLREKVVADQDLLDAGMIFGAGFAPFRGGPMRYSEEHA